LDVTLWGHEDISLTSPPYRRLSRDVIEDVNGEVIELRPCARELLSFLRDRGFGLAVASWNLPEPAVKALEALNLLEYFDVVVVEPHPNKELMLREIMSVMRVSEGEVVFIDDNPYITERVSRAYPELLVLRFGVDVTDYCVFLEEVRRALGG